MSENPYVKAPTDPAWHTGLGAVSSVFTVAGDLQSGNWVAAGLDGGLAGIVIADTVVDPIGAAISAGVGFIIDHLEPLRTWFNDLTGDHAAVAAYAGTLNNVAAGLTAEADTLVRMVGRDFGEQAGEIVAAYQAMMSDIVTGMQALAAASEATATAMKIASAIVMVVHNTVRDAIAGIVAEAIKAAAALIMTLGAGTPFVIASVAEEVGRQAIVIGGRIAQLLHTVKALSDLMTKLKTTLTTTMAKNAAVNTGYASTATGTADMASDEAAATRASTIDAPLSAPVEALTPVETTVPIAPSESTEPSGSSDQPVIGLV